MQTTKQNKLSNNNNTNLYKKYIFQFIYFNNKIYIFQLKLIIQYIYFKLYISITIYIIQIKIYKYILQIN